MLWIVTKLAWARKNKGDEWVYFGFWKALVAEFEKALDGEKIQEMSTKDDEESVGAVKTVACEMLLQHRVELKFKNRKVDQLRW